MNTLNLKLQNLVEIISKGETALFLGRGLADELKGSSMLPSDKHLVEELAKRCNYQGEDKSLPRVAQSYEERHNRQALLDYMLEFIDKATDHNRAPIPMLYRLIVGLPFKGIITTIHDDTLERALTEWKRPYTAIVEDQDLVRSDKLPLLYFYGYYKRPATMFITPDSLELSSAHKVREFLQQFVSYRTLVFIGLSATDRVFLEFYHKVIKSLSQNVQRRAYIFTIDKKQTEQFWSKGSDVELLETTSHDGLLTLHNLWLSQQINAIEPEFTRAKPPILDKPTSKIQYFGATPDQTLATSIVPNIAQLLNLEHSEPIYLTPASQAPAITLAPNLLTNEFMLFDIRQNSAEVWILLGISIGLNQKCFGLALDEDQTSMLNWLELNYTTNPNELAKELTTWWRRINQAAVTAGPTMPKLGICLLLDLTQEEKEKNRLESQIKEQLSGQLEIERFFLGESSPAELLKILHTANLVVIRADDHLSAKANIVLGMALSTGAAVILVTEVESLQPNFMKNDLPFVLQISPKKFQGIQLNHLPESGTYFLPDTILSHIERLISERNLKTAWSICNQLVHALPYFTATYNKRAEIYKLCNQEKNATKQYLLELNLAPESVVEQQFYKFQMQGAKRAKQNNQLDQVLLWLEPVRQRSNKDQELQKSLEDMIAYVHKTFNQKKEELGNAIRTLDFSKYDDNFQDVTMKISMLQEKFTSLTQIINTNKAPLLSQNFPEDIDAKPSIADDNRFWQKMNETLKATYYHSFSNQVSNLQGELRRTEQGFQKREQTLQTLLKQKETELSKIHTQLKSVEESLEEKQDELKQKEKELKRQGNKLRHIMGLEYKVEKFESQQIFMKVAVPVIIITVSIGGIIWWPLIIVVLILWVLGIILWQRRQSDPSKETA